MVGGKVYDQGIGAGLGQFPGDRPGLAVGQGEDDDIVAGEHLGGGIGDDEVRVPGKVGWCLPSFSPTLE